MPTITAIVNIYKRPHTLDEQIQAIREQTIKPECIFIWNNGNRDINLDKYKDATDIRVFDNNYNYGVWSRFLIGFLAPSEYICIFDDDTIPGKRWFENCLDSMKQKEALYGTIGVVFENRNDEYKTHWRYGWDGAEDTTQYVDIVGHSWFFKREWLKYFVMEPTQVYETRTNGEDIHFSFMLQKYANIQTCVPPHPVSNRELWGSMPKTAWIYGSDGNSETDIGMIKTYSEYMARGFRKLIERTVASSDQDIEMFVQMIQERKPFAIIRPSDGEYLVMQNRTLTNIDNWTYTNGGALKDTLTNAVALASKTSCYIGIPCNCCSTEIAKWYVETFDIHPLYLTFANIFCNKNWKRWVEFVKHEVHFTLVAPVNRSNLSIEQHIHIPEFLVSTWDSDGEACVANILKEIKTKKGRVVMFACGPVAKILIARAWSEHPYNIYLDIGSSLDLFLKGSTNRSYAKEGGCHSEQICRFNNDLIKSKPKGKHLWGTAHEART